MSRILEPTCQAMLMLQLQKIKVQKLLPLEPNFGPFEDTGRVAIAEMVVTKTPNIHSRGVPHPKRDQQPILKDDGTSEVLPLKFCHDTIPDVIYSYLVVAGFVKWRPSY